MSQQPDPLSTLVALDERVVIECPNCRERFLPLPVPVLYGMKLASQLIGCTEKSLPTMLEKAGFERIYRHRGRNRLRCRMVTGEQIKALYKKFHSTAPAAPVPIKEVHRRAQARRERDKQFRLGQRNATSR